jgi:hypothetical protein
VASIALTFALLFIAHDPSAGDENGDERAREPGDARAVVEGAGEDESIVDDALVDDAFVDDAFVEPPGEKRVPAALAPALLRGDAPARDALGDDRGAHPDVPPPIDTLPEPGVRDDTARPRRAPFHERDFETPRPTEVESAPVLPSFITIAVQVVVGTIASALIGPLFCLTPIAVAYIVTSIGNLLDDKTTHALPSAFSGFVGLYMTGIAIGVGVLTGTMLLLVGSVLLSTGACTGVFASPLVTGFVLPALALTLYAAPLWLSGLLALGTSLGATVGNHLAASPEPRAPTESPFPDFFRSRQRLLSEDRARVLAPLENPRSAMRY